MNSVFPLTCLNTANIIALLEVKFYCTTHLIELQQAGRKLTDDALRDLVPFVHFKKPEKHQ